MDEFEDIDGLGEDTQLDDLEEVVVNPEEEIEDSANELESDGLSKEKSEEVARNLLKDQVDDYIKELKRKKRKSAKGVVYKKLYDNAVELFKKKNFNFNLLLDRATYRKSIPDEDTLDRIRNSLIELKKRRGFQKRDDFMKTFGYRARGSTESARRVGKPDIYYSGIVQFVASDHSFNISVNNLLDDATSPEELGVNPLSTNYDEIRNRVESNPMEVTYVPDISTDKIKVACSCNSYFYYFSASNFKNNAMPIFSKVPKFSGVKGDNPNLNRNPNDAPGICKHLLCFIQGYLLPEGLIGASKRDVYQIQSEYRDEKTPLEKIALRYRKERENSLSGEARYRKENVLEPKQMIARVINDYILEVNPTKKELLMKKLLARYSRLNNERKSDLLKYMTSQISAKLKSDDLLRINLDSMRKRISLEKNRIYDKKRRKLNSTRKKKSTIKYI